MRSRKPRLLSFTTLAVLPLFAGLPLVGAEEAGTPRAQRTQPAGAATPSGSGEASGSIAGDATLLGQVGEFNDGLLEVMRGAEEFGYGWRYERLSPLLAENFDLPFMARFSLGRNWRDLGDGQQQRWLDVFRQMTTATYAGRFKGYSGQQFETLGQEPAAQNTVFVRTRLSAPEEENIELTYRLRETPAGWRIIDCYLNGTVSELALRRSDYSAVLKREGFDKLVEHVERKIANLAAGKVD